MRFPSASPFIGGHIHRSGLFLTQKRSTHVFQFLLNRFSSRQAQSKQIAKICAVSLKELGLNVGGNVFQLINSKGIKGWLVSLQVPENFRISPVDALALRLFLARQIESSLKMPPKSLGLVLSFSNEARKLPMAEAAVDGKWIKARIPVWMAGVTQKPSAPRSGGHSSSAPPTSPISSRPGVSPTAYGNTTPLRPATPGSVRVATNVSSATVASVSAAAAAAALAKSQPSRHQAPPPVSPSADEQSARLETLLAAMDDDVHYEVQEASMTDFDRALEPD